MENTTAKADVSYLVSVNFKSRNELKAGLPAVLKGLEPASIAKRK
jgi:hypothetical protein